MLGPFFVHLLMLVLSFLHSFFRLICLCFFHVHWSFFNAFLGCPTLVLSKQSGYNCGFLENTLSRKNRNFMNCRIDLCTLVGMCFHEISCFSDIVVALILIYFWKENWPKMDPQIYRNPCVEITWLQKSVPCGHPFSTKIDPGAHIDFWKPFGHQLAPFWLPFGALLVAFGTPAPRHFLVGHHHGSKHKNHEISKPHRIRAGVHQAQLLPGRLPLGF